MLIILLLLSLPLWARLIRWLCRQPVPTPPVSRNPEARAPETEPPANTDPHDLDNIPWVHALGEDDE